MSVSYFCRSFLVRWGGGALIVGTCFLSPSLIFSPVSTAWASGGGGGHGGGGGGEAPAGPPIPDFAKRTAPPADLCPWFRDVVVQIEGRELTIPKYFFLPQAPAIEIDGYSVFVTAPHLKAYITSKTGKHWEISLTKYSSEIKQKKTSTGCFGYIANKVTKIR
jgi:hypothetical protein